jgi:flagellar protein FlgJ
MRIDVSEQAQAQRGASARRAEVEPVIVPVERTAVSREQIRASLGRAWERARGAPPSARTLDVLTAHASLETARGSRMYNFNFGGIKGTSPSGLTTGAMTHEVIDGQRTSVRAFFRAYRSLDEGAEDFVGLLQRRYGSALDAAAAGDPDAYAHALKSRGYYTGDEDDYANTLRGLMGLPPAQRAPNGALPDDMDPTRFGTTVELARVLDAVARSAARIAAPDDRENTDVLS